MLTSVAGVYRPITAPVSVLETGVQVGGGRGSAMATDRGWAGREGEKGERRVPGA